MQGLQRARAFGENDITDFQHKKRVLGCGVECSEGALKWNCGGGAST